MDKIKPKKIEKGEPSHTKEIRETPVEKEISEPLEFQKSREEIKKEILEESEKIDLDESLRQSSKKQAENIKTLEEEGQVKKL
ncbi:MAG: hypothetical protein AAB877_03605, partial [Patescibacteria group bacterium]